jgi:hypothetical protein
LTERAERRRRRRRRRTTLVVTIAVVAAAIVGGALLLTGTGSDESASTNGGRVVASRPTTTSSTTTTTAPTTTTTIDPATLPQTTDKPADASPQLDARAQALWHAIASDDPPQAMPFFFPLGAYVQVKDIRDPPSDWQQRLVAAYERDIHTAHATLGQGAASATFDGISIPDAAQWVDPGQEYNKIGYWRVYGTRVSYTANGSPGSLTIASMISWRGEWYVVHFARIE